MADNLDFKQTTVTLASSVGALIVNRNPARQYLAIMNTNTGSATIHFRTLPTSASGGIALDPASGAGGQGGSWEWKDPVPTNPVYAYSAVGTTIVVIEG